MKSLKIYKVLILLLISGLFFLISFNEGMFWDNVLFASKMGNHLYKNGLFKLYMPDYFDPGHPPFLAFIQALGWKIFGHQLWASHLVMLPFVFGLLWQLHSLVSVFIKKTSMRITALILIVADPTLSAQLLLVSPEVIQLFFFFMVINAVLTDKTWLKIVGLSFLGIVTYRGMMLCAGVFFFELCNYLWINKKNFSLFFSKKMLISYILGGLPAVLYVAWRILVKGWLQTHPDSPWTDLWQFVTLKEFFINIIVLCQRYADFGRIVVILFVCIAFFSRRNSRNNKAFLQLLLLSVTSVIVIIVVSLIAKNPFGHRYFIASFIAFILSAFVALQQFKYRKLIYVAMIISLLTGNLWIYPEKIAQGWDASLAHIPYFDLRRKAIKYLDAENIPINKTASFFPNATTIDNVDLSGDTRSFESFNGNNQYIFHATVYNLTDDQYYILESRYHILKQFSKRGISVKILEKGKK